MKNNTLIRIALVLTLVITVAADGGSQTKGGKPAGLGKTTTNDIYRPMLINNVFNYYGNNGDGSYNKFSSSGEGFEFLKGRNLATVMYEDGVVWGCKQVGTTKVGGSVYWHGVQAGPIIVNGTSSALPVADDPSNPANRAYSVRRDMAPIQGVTNPDDPLAASELAAIRSSELPMISRYEAVTAEGLLQQYWNDWLNWPAAEGAPYTDVNHNGTYDPTIDAPGVPGADQTIWYVANDCDGSRTANLAGSAPIGVEMQKTIWAFNLPGALGNTIFASTRLINKSGVQLDSVYLAQWSDPDIGYFADDFVGCDTALSLGYAYNGAAVDANFAAYGIPPPAAGFCFLQGPLVQGAPTDTAVFGLARRPGFKNLPMSSFTFFTQGSQIYIDPVQGPGGYLQWYNLLRGTIATTGAPFINPITNQPTPFVLSGDPVAGTGWIDGTLVPPSDRRMVMSSGPFTMPAGDTQEVVVACLVSRGADYLSSVTALKTDVRDVRQVYTSLNTLLPPQMSYTVTKSSNQATISFRSDVRHVHATGVAINLKAYDGTPVASVTLADDGLHNDGAAGDGVFGGSFMGPQQQAGLQAEAVVTYQGGNVVSWAHAFDNITTADFALASYSVASDNINNDGIPNPGENVRYVFSLNNNSPVTLSNLTVTAAPAVVLQQFSIPTLAAGSTFALVYDENNPVTYLAFDVPRSYVDSTFAVQLFITDKSYNQWIDTLLFNVKPLKYALHYTPLTHVAGNATGSFTILVVDSTKLKNHLYVIRGVDTVGSLGGYTLKDSTAGIVLIQNHPLPDSLGQTSPIVDGFKVLRGTIDTRPGMKGWTIPSGTRHFSPVGGALFGLEGFSNGGDPNAPQDRTAGTIGMGANLSFGGIGTTLSRPRDYHDVLLKWAAVPGDTVNLWDPNATPADTNYSVSYRYLRSATAPSAKPSFAPWIKVAAAGYPYQDYVYGVPFSAWDLSYTPPRRLAVGHLENNAAGGLVDGRYWPGLITVDNGDVNGPREMCFIYSSPYTAAPVAPMNTNIASNTTMPIMWVLTCSRRNDPPYSSSDQFEIIANHLPSSQDMWTFNTSILTHAEQGSVPYTFSLSQNFPNPFNPSTTIRYQIPAGGKVTLRIYNILGQIVRTLVDDVQTAGPHTVYWNSRNDAGNSVASGVYFYRCTALPGAGGTPFTQTMKMVLLK